MMNAFDMGKYDKYIKKNTISSHRERSGRRWRDGRDRIVVSTSRCGRDNPGSNPGHGRVCLCYGIAAWSFGSLPSISSADAFVQRTKQTRKTDRVGGFRFHRDLNSDRRIQSPEC